MPRLHDGFQPQFDKRSWWHRPSILGDRLALISRHPMQPIIYACNKHILMVPSQHRGKFGVCRLTSATGGPGAPTDRATQWFDNPVQTIAVKPTGPFSATADGACPVEFGSQEVAFVKPRPDAARNLVVAREKIAADLARLLGLPVAPVVVRTPDASSAHHSAMSLAMLSAARHWGSGGHAHLNSVAETLERMRVFWTWIGDVDHNGHPQNLLYAIDNGACAVLAIDHSYSLCHGNAANSLATGLSQGYGTMVLPGREAWTRAARDTILALDWAAVENMVRRLQVIVTTDEQDRILQILQERRDHLATLLGL